MVALHTGNRHMKKGNSTIAVSAPGKLMIMGEHAVVYGYPSIVTAVDKRLVVEAHELQESADIIEAPQVKNTLFIQEAIRDAKKAFGISTGVRVRTESSFSNAYGFGSSSAVVVATIKALGSLFGKTIGQRALFDMAYRIVLGVQRVGSGFDVAAAVYGGTLLFRTGGKQIVPLPLSVPLIVGYTGVKADTPTIVRSVAETRHKNRDKTEEIFTGIGELVLKAKNSLVHSRWQELGDLMNECHAYLKKLGVSTPMLERLVAAARQGGAWGAKLSGAGGGDCMIAIAPSEKRKAISKAIENAGGEVVRVVTGAVGVTVETTDDQEELFVVVDKNDNILGYRSRATCHSDRSLIHRSVGVIISDRRGRILLQKRSLTKDLQPGLWGVSAAGHVARGETYDAAVARELKEELGVLQPLTFVGKSLFRDKQETEMQAIYTARTEGPFRPDGREIAELRFFGKPELARGVSSGDVVLTTWAKKVLKLLYYLP